MQQQKVVTKISKFIEFASEQKERAATVVLEEFLLRQGEKLIKSGREKRIASDHSVTVRGCEWFDHAPNEVGRAEALRAARSEREYAPRVCIPSQNARVGCGCSFVFCAEKDAL